LISAMHAVRQATAAVASLPAVETMCVLFALQRTCGGKIKYI